MARHARERNARFARAIGRFGGTLCLALAAFTTAFAAMRNDRAVVSVGLHARLRSSDPEIVATAFEEFEATTSAKPLPAELLPTLVQLALHGPESVRKRAVWRFTDALDADPAPLADYWRARHASSPSDAARLASLIAQWGERALPLLETIVGEGGAEDREQVLKVLADPTLACAKAPLGDGLLLATIRRDGAAHRKRTLAALERHPAIVKSVLEVVEPWLATSAWRTVVTVAAAAGPDAAPLLPAILARAEGEGVALARLARELAQLGPSAVEPIGRAFDRARDDGDRVELAAALLALDVRRDEALAAACDALDSKDAAVRRAAWVVLARAFGLPG